MRESLRQGLGNNKKRECSGSSSAVLDSAGQRRTGIPLLDPSPWAFLHREHPQAGIMDFTRELQELVAPLAPHGAKRASREREGL